MKSEVVTLSIQATTKYMPASQFQKRFKPSVKRHKFLVRSLSFVVSFLFGGGGDGADVAETTSPSVLRGFDRYNDYLIP